VTKLRQGEGVYTFENPYFQYKGQYDRGVKQGQGVLLMRDGSRYEGEFADGEITGQGERVYPDGTIYKGQFMQGEKHGYGEVQYKKTGEWYKGEWHLNVRQGQGTLFTKEKNTFTVRYLKTLYVSRVTSAITGLTVFAPSFSTTARIITETLLRV
jgi:hypothetical protein